MKIITGKQMKEADRETVEKYNTPVISLMENAALSMIPIIEKVMENYTRKNILIFAGKGNNGGDGSALGRILHNMGYNVVIIFLDKKNSLTGDALINYKRADNVGIITEVNTLSKIKKQIENANIVIDAIFGTGIKGEIKEPYKSIIEHINKYSKYTISADIPSGVNADTGEVTTIAVIANCTISFACAKLGSLTREGSEYSGIIHVTDIGIHPDALNNIKTKYHYINRKEAKELLPKRKVRSNKGTFGKISIIAGQISMIGAAFFASKSAYKIGAGVVHTYTSKEGIHPLQTLIPEAIIHPMEKEYIIENFQKITHSNAIIIGPGLGVNPYNKEILVKILTEAISPVVIDADGINNLVEIKDSLKNAKSLPVITPHPGEMSRLIGKTIDEILKNPIEIASNFAKEYNCIVLLKDFRTIIAHPNGTIHINTTGSNALAKAGSGDVLSGIIGGLIAQGCPSYEASILGAYIHGLSGEYAAKDLTNYSLLTRDIIDYIPMTLKYILNDNS